MFFGWVLDNGICLLFAYIVQRVVVLSKPNSVFLVGFLVGLFCIKSKTEMTALAFKKRNKNTQEVKNDRFLIPRRQNNVRIFDIRCL